MYNLSKPRFLYLIIGWILSCDLSLKFKKKVVGYSIDIYATIVLLEIHFQACHGWCFQGSYVNKTDVYFSPLIACIHMYQLLALWILTSTKLPCQSAVFHQHWVTHPCYFSHYLLFSLSQYPTVQSLKRDSIICFPTLNKTDSDACTYEDSKAVPGREELWRFLWSTALMSTE